MSSKRVSYVELDTINQWQAAAIQKALEMAIERGDIHQQHGDRLLELFSRISKPGNVLRFE